MAKKNIGATLALKNGNFFTGLKSASSATDSFKSKLSGATSGLKTHGSQLSATGNSLKSLAGKVVGVVAAYASMRQIVSFTKDCISAANTQTEAEKRLEHEMLNVVGATQQQVDSIKKYASELQGLTTVGDEVALSGASQLASFKLQTDTIKTLMPALEDLAVGQNGVTVSSDQMKSAADMIGKAMSGNITTLKKLVPSMSASQQSILKNGSEAEKAAVVVDLLKEKYGGLAEAMANTPEGRIQQLKNAWGDMQEVVGAKLYPVITKVLTWATDKIPVVQDMLSGVMDKLQPVFSWVGNSALPMIENAFKGIIGIGQSIYDAVAPSFEKIKDAFGTVKTALSDAFGNTSAISNITDVIGGVIGSVVSITADVISSVMEVVAPILPDIMNIVGAISGIISSAVSVIRDVISSVMDAVTPILPDIMDIVGKIAGTIKEVLPPIGQAVLRAIKAIAGVVKSVVKTISPLLKPIVGIISGIVGVLVKVLVPIITTVVDVAAGVIERISGLLEGILGVASNVWNGIKDAASKPLSALKDTFSDSLNSVKSAYEEHGGGIKGIAAGAIEGMKQYYLAGYNYLNNLTGGKLGEMLSGVGEKMSAVKDTISTKWEEIKSGAAEKWQAITSSVKQFAENIRSGLVNKFTAVKDGIVGIWNGIVSGIKGCINRIISAVNTMIGGVNKISFNAPDWVPVMGGKKWGINIPKIPMLANGGVIKQPGTVIVGERGPETLTLPKGASVTPLDKGKRSETNNHFDINININGVNQPLDDALNEALDRFVAKLKLQMANL